MGWFRRSGPEDNAPRVDDRGVPDLHRFHESPNEYRRLHREALRDGDFNKRVQASWGLIARGGESMPQLMDMLADSAPEAREDAAGALAWLGAEQPDVVQALISALARATGHEERDSVILALGATRRKEAIPALESILRDANADGDTRHTAAEALGQVVRRRFDRQPDPVAAAVGWLDRSGYMPLPLTEKNRLLVEYGPA